MLRWMKLSMPAILLSVMLGCQDGIKTSDADVNPIQRSELDQFMAEPGTVLLDVRKPEAFTAGHIPGAINMPFTSLRQDTRLTNADRIVVYGGGWRDPLPVAGAKRLIQLGYTNVYEFKGGTELWVDSGGALVKTTPGTQSRPESGD